MASPAELAAELTETRDAALRELGRVDDRSLTTPGLIGEWSGRELIAHLGYWAGSAVELIHAAEEGRIDEAFDGKPATDEVNATVARVARDTPLATVRAREEASVEALLERLGRMDGSLLAVRLPDGATLEEGIREDGPDHYREHADELRRLLDDGAHD